MWNKAQLHHRIFLAGLILAVVALPLSRALLSISLLVLVANWVVEGDFRKKWGIIKKKRFIWLFMGFYAIHLFGLLYTVNLEPASKSLIVKLPLLFFPLVTVTAKKLTRSEFNLIIRAFVSASLFAGAICVGLALYENYHTGKVIPDPYYFTYFQFSGYIFLHPTYFSLFLNLAILALGWLWYDRRRYGEKVYPIRNILQMVVLFSLVLMLSARMQILILLALFGMILLYIFYQRGKLMAGLGLTVATGVIAFLLIFSNPANQARFKDIFSSGESYTGKIEHSGKAVRVYIWDKAFGLIVNHPWLGVGTGDSLDELAESYRDGGFAYGYKTRLNAHNQYLETAVALGLVGMIYLIACFVFSAGFAIRRKNYLYLGFVILFALSCLTESLLSRQLGVNFYACFNAILAFQAPFLRNAHVPPVQV
ncbi:MAG: O-antigen ligase family protein [Bacteroidia bacterium]|nr:O-antigen ligase family protein [Bacteroidia bacterium]